MKKALFICCVARFVSNSFELRYGRALNIWTEYLSMTEEIADVFKAESAIPHFFLLFLCTMEHRGKKNNIFLHFCISISGIRKDGTKNESVEYHGNIPYSYKRTQKSLKRKSFYMSISL